MYRITYFWNVAHAATVLPVTKNIFAIFVK